MPRGCTILRKLCARASRAAIRTFAHNDPDDLADVLERERRNFGTCLVVTEGVFSMDGDCAPLDRLAAVAADHDAWLMVDDAHGFGTLGNGRGSAWEFDPRPDIPLQMGTLSKAAGVYGAFLCASAPVIELMKNRARSLVYTTGLPPGVIASCIAAVDIIANDSERVSRPLHHARSFCALVGLPAPESAIVPLVVGTEQATLGASAALEDAQRRIEPLRDGAPAVLASLELFAELHIARRVCAAASAGLQRVGPASAGARDAPSDDARQFALQRVGAAEVVQPKPEHTAAVQPRRMAPSRSWLPGAQGLSYGLQQDRSPAWLRDHEHLESQEPAARVRDEAEPLRSLASWRARAPSPWTSARPPPTR